MSRGSLRKGFSLVELSIVLIILGLLTGGILAGQSLIRAAELRSVITEYSRWITSAQTFRDKYLSYPGDFAKATQFWGRAFTATDCVTNSSAPVGTPGACDGNGNGSITDAGGTGQSGERWQFWKHLALAGIIEGTYSGLLEPTGATPGINNPPSRINSSYGWNVLTRGIHSGTAGSAFAADYGTYFAIGSGSINAALYKPEEAWNIDTKLDDGQPATGKVIASYISTCTDAGSGPGSPTAYAALYLLSSPSPPPAACISSGRFSYKKPWPTALIPPI